MSKEIGNKKDYNSEKKVNKEPQPARWDEDNDEESECKNMSFITCSKLKQIKEKLAKLGHKYYISAEKLKLTIEIPPHNLQGQQIQAKMSLKIGHSPVDNVTSITVYPAQIWILTDAYVDVAPSMDGFLQIYKNGVFFLGSTPYLSEMLKQQPSRRTLTMQHIFRPGVILSINFIPSTTNDSDSKMIEYATIEVIQIIFGLSSDEVYNIADMLEKQS